MLSIITPSFRQLDWLRLCVASVADQAGVSVEHIIQDGETEGIAEQEIRTCRDKEDYTLRLISEQDDGMYDAINRGLRRCTGEICAYLNCDEQYLPGTLAKVSAFFDAHPEVDALFGDVILIDRNGHPLSYRRTIRPRAEHLRLSHLNTASCSTFFRRRLLDRGFYFDPQWKAIGDMVWVDRLLQEKIRMETVPEALATFAFTGANLGATALCDQEFDRWRGPLKHALARKMFAVLRHRLLKTVAGAYRARAVEIAVYTHDSPRERQRRSGHNIGFKWPRALHSATLASSGKRDQ